MTTKLDVPAPARSRGRRGGRPPAEGIARLAPAVRPVPCHLDRHPDPGLRRHMIEEAAYYRALNRGFAGGNAERDWLDAEAEIDQVFEGERYGGD